MNGAIASGSCGKDERTMQMEIEMDDENREKKRLLAAGRFLLWALMIGISALLASRSLMV